MQNDWREKTGRMATRFFRQPDSLIIAGNTAG
jgi:hypothetical protein